MFYIKTQTMKNTYKLKLKKRIFMLLAAAVLMSQMIISCSKFADDLDFDKLITPGWNAEFAVPLVNTTYRIMDFFNEENQEFIQIDADGLISLVYSSKEIFSAKAEDFIKLPDQSVGFSLPLIFPLRGEIDTIFYNFDYIFVGESDDQRIDSIFLKGGSLRVSGNTNLNRNKSDLVIILPEFLHKTNGQQLQFDISLDNPEGQLNSVFFDSQVDLSEYKLTINPDGSGLRNEINFLSKIIVYHDDNPIIIPYEFNVDISFTSLEFQELYGYLGKYSLEFADSVKINIYQNAIGGGVQFGSDALNFIITTRNSIGVPIAFESEEFYVYSPHNPPYFGNLHLFGEGTENRFDILSPDFTEIGQSVETILNFSQTNFPEVFLSMAPKFFYFDFDATLNILGDTTAQNFIQDTSRISFGTSLAFQMYTAIDLLSFQDTIDFKIDSSIDDIDYLLFRITAENGFPLSALIQLYFADSQYNVIDSLIYDNDTRIIAGAQVGLPPKLRVTKPTLQTTDIRIDTEWLGRVTKANFLLIRAGLKTTDGNMAKIYDDYGLNLKIGINAGLNITGDN